MESDAVQKVFDTVELLETILLDVDVHTVLLAQRTSKSFQATIVGSPTLQRRLYCENRLYFRPGTYIPSSRDRQSHRWRILPEFGFINTPEGYRICIQDFSSNGVVMFSFIGTIPTLQRPATGSWRKMHLPTTNRTFAYADYRIPDGSIPERVDREEASKDPMPMYYRRVKLRQQTTTADELLDRLMKAAPHYSSGCIGCLWCMPGPKGCMLVSSKKC